MFDTSPEGIRKLIEQGESDVVEIKRRIPHDPVLAIILTSFANAEGGILLMGVDDRQGVVGVPDFDVKEALEHLKRAVQNLLPTPTEVNAVLIDNRWVPYVVVKPAPPHLRPVRTAAGTVFVRTGAQTRRELLMRRLPRLSGEKGKSA